MFSRWCNLSFLVLFCIFLYHMRNTYQIDWKWSIHKSLLVINIKHALSALTDCFSRERQRRAGLAEWACPSGLRVRQMGVENLLPNQTKCQVQGEILPQKITYREEKDSRWPLTSTSTHMDTYVYTQTYYILNILHIKGPTKAVIYLVSIQLKLMLN